MKWRIAAIAPLLALAAVLGMQATISIQPGASAGLESRLSLYVRPYVGSPGTTSPEPGTAVYPYNAEVAISAIPYSGWEFWEWRGACTGAGSSLTLRLGLWSVCTVWFRPMPVANLDVGPGQTVYAGDRVYFTAAVDGANGRYVDFRWDFGDGSTTSLKVSDLLPGPEASHEGTVDHVYVDPGIYTVDVEACQDFSPFDAGEGQDWGSCTSGSLLVEVLPDNLPPVVDAGPDEMAAEGDTVNFSGSASDPDGIIVSTEWTFGDGDSASGTLTPTHVYVDDGIYTATLTACDNDGECTSDSLRVDIATTPTPTPTPTPVGQTPTPTPTPTATPAGQTPTPTGTVRGDTATPFATSTPTDAPGEERVWGDNNCSGSADPVDSLLTLRHDAGLGANTGDCPNMGQVVDVQNASPHAWGDVDCGGDVTPVDSLKLLRYDAGLSVAQEAGCPLIGSAVLVVE